MLGSLPRLALLGVVLRLGSLACAQLIPTSQLNYNFSVPGNIVIDQFKDINLNAIGGNHGTGEGLPLQWALNSIVLHPNDPDQNFYTVLGEGCSADLTVIKDHYLHIWYQGQVDFSVSLTQQNDKCSEKVMPSPETWDSVQIRRYGKNGHAFIPLKHFNIDQTRALAVMLHGFHKPGENTTVRLMEFTPFKPVGLRTPPKIPTAPLVLKCKRPNSFAFGIDDGDPKLAQQALQIIKDEGIHVTFFVVGRALKDPEGNFTAIYREAKAHGHQIGYHSQTHPKLEALTEQRIADEYFNMEWTLATKLGVVSKYLRPPFGTAGARMRQLAARWLGNDSYVVNWSVDVEDWKWGQTKSPRMQLQAFKRDLAAGGDIVVMHYLYPSTVHLFRDFIRAAKASGKQIMRIDQCMMDPRAPPLKSEQLGPASASGPATPVGNAPKPTGNASVPTQNVSAPAGNAAESIPFRSGVFSRPAINTSISSLPTITTTASLSNASNYVPPDVLSMWSALTSLNHGTIFSIGLNTTLVYTRETPILAPPRTGNDLSTLTSTLTMSTATKEAASTTVDPFSLISSTPSSASSAMTSTVPPISTDKPSTTETTTVDSDETGTITAEDSTNETDTAATGTGESTGDASKSTETIDLLPPITASVVETPIEPAASTITETATEIIVSDGSMDLKI